MDGKVHVLELPVPPSNNRYYRHTGRSYLSQEGRIYKYMVQACAEGSGIAVSEKAIRIVIQYHPQENKIERGNLIGRKRLDIDAVCKGILDGLEGVAYVNDHQILELTVLIQKPLPSKKVIVRWEELDIY